MNNTNNNTRIAKNTVVLYFRMFITLAVGLYTTRVIINALGVDDYGIYNVVGGFVTMFSIISFAISGAISRFLTFELGRNNIEKLKIVFSSSMMVEYALSFIIVIVAETIGLWFLHNKMVIPLDRMCAAEWVFQLSILTLVLGLVSIPYNSLIVAHERMGVYAYVSIFEAVSKLVIAFLIINSPIDRLVYYSILLCVLSLLIRIYYAIYCRKTFEECSYKFVLEKDLLKQIFVFAGWNFIGSSAALLRDQGGNVLLNMFGGPVVNAANGIAQIVKNVASNFTSSFTTALRPQITKSYAIGDFDTFNTLINKGTKFSYYLMLLVTVPLILNSEFVLKLWLGNVPQYTVAFLNLCLTVGLIDTLSTILIIGNQATGNIRNLQIFVGGFLLLNLPISYIALKLGAPIICVYVVNLIMSFVALFIRIYIVKKDFPGWSARLFFYDVIVKSFMVSVIPVFFTYPIFIYVHNSWICFACSCLISVLLICVLVLYIGCSNDERKYILKKVKLIIKNNHN